ncbi:hypothetical protein JCM9140_2844 [Halalkalibacter wakoensis JCM 9140]|uniref:Periplasmic binding protein domain-containing protein n=1 Tax=Halalkalibacter wakoensis JCM 9140 TaxID=1236970 RepID=W4Q439_9BACI|nr:sugar-binding protein [Halalkalibacter wakoensis]GAE26752.1 hypothetical protein JCM9140_2844 [Halalkalibacter wakoensis JCM 9140]
MKHSYYIYGLLLTITGISVLLTYHFFMQSLDFEVPLNASGTTLDSEYHLALIVQEKETPYLQELYSGANDAAKENGITIEYMGTKQTNISDHIKLIEMAIASKVDGILTQGLSNEFEPVLTKALEKGIPVIIVDSDLENNELVTYVGTNNYQAGYEMGRAVLHETIGETKVGIITGSFIPNNLNERVQGFIDATSLEDRIEVVSIESSNLSKIQAAEKTYQMLKNNPEISILLGTSALDSLGIVEGIQKGNPTTDMSIYAFDALEETIEFIIAGDIHATLKQEPYEMGHLGVNLLIDRLEGKEILKEYHTSITILTKEDVVDEY